MKKILFFAVLFMFLYSLAVIADNTTSPQIPTVDKQLQPTTDQRNYTHKRNYIIDVARRDIKI